jgi:hypothetical protein
MTSKKEKIAQKEQTSFEILTHEELLVIFYKFEAFVKSLDLDLQNKRIGKRFETPMGIGMAYKNIDDEKIEKLKVSKPYVLSKNIIEKLQPLVELIEDCDPEMKALSNKLK